MPWNLAFDSGTALQALLPDDPSLAEHVGQEAVARGQRRVKVCRVGRENILTKMPIDIAASGQTEAGKLQPNPAVPMWNALGGYGYLVQNGVLPTYWDNPSDYRYTFANQLHPRTAIGVSADRSPWLTAGWRRTAKASVWEASL